MGRICRRFLFDVFLIIIILIPAAATVEHGYQTSDDGFGTGYDVERVWQGTALLDVFHVKLSACKLPFKILIILKKTKCNLKLQLNVTSILL